MFNIYIYTHVYAQVLSCLMFYKCSVREYFTNDDDMYKKYPMGQSISDTKFRKILSTFRSVHDRGRDGLARRGGLNELMALQRRRYAALLYDMENTMTSLDDDKQRMRSFCATRRALFDNVTRRGVLVLFSTLQCLS